MTLFKRKLRVGIGISGGVDSAFSAYILKEKGYEVIGFFMHNWDSYLNENKSSEYCSQLNDWNDALSVANYIGIKIYKLNFVEEYWNEVFSEFLHLLKKGMTPNPDILCNNVIKFNYFFNYIVDNFFVDFVSTGHYARILNFSDKYYLSKAKDEKKDQTYFLCQINRNILKKICFPLSDIKKTNVRLIASHIGLPVAKKKDSTGICFIGENKFNSFVSDYFSEKEGEIVDIEDGSVLGNHKMIYYFTIGQRRGLNLHSKKKAYYVVAKDIKKNIIYVTNKSKNSLIYSNWCFVSNFIWLIDNCEIISLISLDEYHIASKLRYQQIDIPINIYFFDLNFKNIKISFPTKQLFIAIGQYAVLYYKDICLGGGIIIETESNFNLKKKY